MSVYVVVSDFFNGGLFGIYSTIKRARLAIEHYLEEDESVVSFEDEGGYIYTFMTAAGEQHKLEICWSLMDEEFEEGLIEEDE